MKTPKAEKLPSGKWRCRVVVNGKRESITADTKKEAEQLAAAMKLGYAERISPVNDTIGEIIDQYIALKADVLSPTTLAGYKNIRKKHLREIEHEKSDLTDETVQRWINAKKRAGLSQKTIRNAYGLLTAALNKKFNVSLPQKTKPNLRLPSSEEVEKITSYLHGKPFELPFLLAAQLGLRASEILGLTWDHVTDDAIHINQAKVYGDNGIAIKSPKTTESDRWIPLTPRLKELLQQPHPPGFVVPISRATMANQMRMSCLACGIEPFRMHDLRHYNVSIMIKLQIPDAYGMQRIGHTSNYTYKHVYGYIMDDGKQDAADKLSNYFGHKMDTKK